MDHAHSGIHGRSDRGGEVASSTCSIEESMGESTLVLVLYEKLQVITIGLKTVLILL